MSEPLLRVLLVDDEELVRIAVRDWLEDEYFTVVEAMSGAVALELLAQEQFDCGILDLQLTDMRGVDVLKNARYVGTPPPWLVMTGNLDAENFQELTSLGVAADTILTKPIFEMSVISAKILTMAGRTRVT